MNEKKIQTVDILIAVAKSGGVENVINMMTNYFCSKDINVRVVQLVYEGDKWLEKEDCFYHLLSGRDGHTLQEFVAEYSLFIKKNGIPNVVVAEAWPYMCYVARMALSLCDSSNTKVISHLHAPLSEYARAGYGDMSHIGLANGHLVISSRISSELEGNVIGKLMDVYNPVDFKKIDAYVRNEEVEKRDDVKKLFFVGRISPEKSLETVLKAISISSDRWQLHIVGAGEPEYENKIKEISKDLGLKENKNIYFYGWQSEPWKIAKDADYIVIASAYEGFPLVAVEALHLGIPVISTPVSGISELVQPGVTGYLFPYNDYEMLGKILKCISKGLFPKIDMCTCVNKVKVYECNNALNDMYEKIINMV